MNVMQLSRLLCLL